jgi:hypothetical protein
MTTEDLRGQVVLITGLNFRVLKAFDLGDEWSLTGYWLDGTEGPDPPHIKHVMCPPQLLSLVDPSTIGQCSDHSGPCPTPGPTGADDPKG